MAEKFEEIKVECCSPEDKDVEIETQMLDSLRECVEITKRCVANANRTRETMGKTKKR